MICLLADIRHKFERKKKRKLTKEEKKIFRNMAEELISNKFGAKRNRSRKPTGSPKPTLTTDQTVDLVRSSDNQNDTNKKIENTTCKTGTKAVLKSGSAVKRKLDEAEPITPDTKAHKDGSILQRKSPFAENTKVSLKKYKLDIPFNKESELAPLKPVFQYKGIRSGEDTDSKPSSPLNLKPLVERVPTDFELVGKDVLICPSDLNYSEVTVNDSYGDNSDLPFGDHSFSTELECLNVSFTRQRGQGRNCRSRGGRGSRSRRKISADSESSTVLCNTNIPDIGQSRRKISGQVRGRENSLQK